MLQYDDVQSSTGQHNTANKSQDSNNTVGHCGIKV